MAGKTVNIPGIGHAIVCSRIVPAKRCVVCHTQFNIKLCDFALSGPKAGQTCDRPVCATHAHHIDPDVDFCPSHARVLEAQQASPLLPNICP